MSSNAYPWTTTTKNFSMMFDFFLDTNASKKMRLSLESLFFPLNLIHKVKYSQPFFVQMVMMIQLTAHENQKAISSKYLKKDYYGEMSTFLKVCSIMHSFNSQSSFCTNYRISAAWHGGDQPLALLRCYGSPGCFDNSPQLVYIVGFLILFLIIPHGFSTGVHVRWVGWPIKNSGVRAKSCWKR